MSDVADPSLPPFLLATSEEAELERRMNSIDREERRIAKARRWGGKLGWYLSAALASVIVVEALTVSALLPLHTIDHHFALIRDDGTSQVLKSSWDLPAAQSKQLILATASRYVYACQEWDWLHAHSDYQFCSDMSDDQRRAEYQTFMNRGSESPSRVYGKQGTVQIITTGIDEVGSNTVRVLYIRFEKKPNYQVTAQRMIATLDYRPVKSIPAEVLLHEPAADIVFLRAQFEPDSTPVMASSMGAAGIKP